MNKKRFLFYSDWKVQMEMMTDEQVRRFVYNLINFTEGKEIELPTKLEQALWIGVLPSLKINQEKYEKRVESNKLNGKLGGRPHKMEDNPSIKNPENPDGFSQNPNNPIKDKRELITDNRKIINDNSKPESENWKMENKELGNGKSENTIDFSDTIEYNEYIPGTNFKIEKDPKFDFHSYLNRKLILYPDWEEDLLQLRMDKFLSNVKKHDPDLVLDEEYAMAYKYYVKNGIL